MKRKIIDILSSVDTTTGTKLIPTWMVEEIATALVENGVMLPTFKVGDIVWVYDFIWGIVPCEVDRPYHCRMGKEGGCTFDMFFEERDIGTYVFSSREDAEAIWAKKEVY